MRVAINLLQLPPGRFEGVTTYVKKLIERLPQVGPDDQYYVFHQPGLEIAQQLDTRITTVAFAQPGLISKAHRKALSLARIKVPNSQAKKIRDYAKREQIDIIHYPFSSIPVTEQKLGVPAVLSVMDIQHEFFPELFSASDLLARRLAYQSSAESADSIIAISEFTKQTLVDKFKIPADKIHVVYLSGDVSAKPDLSIDLPERFMYFPAADWKHKNHARLFRALAQLKKQGFNGKLVLTGVQSDNQAQLQKLMGELGLEDSIIHLGQISFDQVSGVFQRARMLIYPSLFEGFGIPPLEAMSVGVPVACSDTTSLPEVVGDAAVIFDPTDEKAIAEAIKKVWDDENLRARLINKGRKQAAKFSWSRMAEDTHATYKELHVKKST